MMKITEVRISLRDDAKLKAFASITLENCFVIRGLKIIEGKTGTWMDRQDDGYRLGHRDQCLEDLSEGARLVHIGRPMKCRQNVAFRFQAQVINDGALHRFGQHSHERVDHYIAHEMNP